jgi:hypothetical protein
MKTVFLLIIGCIVLSLPVAAQGVQLGFKAGGSRSQLIGRQREFTEASYQTKQHAITSFYASVSLNTPIRRSLHFSFQPELVYLHRGFSIDNGLQKRRDRDQYVELPLLVRYTQQGFFVEVGPQVGYFLYNRTTVTDAYWRNRTYSADVHSEFKFSLGATAGVGYVLASGPSVGVRYTASTGRYTGYSVLAGYIGYTFGSQHAPKEQ